MAKRKAKRKAAAAAVEDEVPENHVQYNRFEKYTMPKTGDEFNAGDTVCLKSGHRSDFVAKIIEFMEEEGNEEVKMRIKWYYLPKETPFGKLKHIGRKEVFESKEEGIQPVDSITMQCTVHTLKSCVALGDNVCIYDYFCRFRYHTDSDKLTPAGKDWEPEEICVYCICNRPYNPDHKYVHCEQCKDWLHLECIGIDPDTLPESYTCEDCQKKKQKK